MYLHPRLKLRRLIKVHKWDPPMTPRTETRENEAVTPRTEIREEDFLADPVAGPCVESGKEDGVDDILLDSVKENAAKYHKWKYSTMNRGSSKEVQTHEARVAEEEGCEDENGRCKDFKATKDVLMQTAAKYHQWKYDRRGSQFTETEKLAVAAKDWGVQTEDPEEKMSDDMEMAEGVPSSLERGQQRDENASDRSEEEAEEEGCEDKNGRYKDFEATKDVLMQTAAKYHQWKYDRRGSQFTQTEKLAVAAKDWDVQTEDPEEKMSDDMEMAEGVASSLERVHAAEHPDEFGQQRMEAVMNTARKYHEWKFERCHETEPEIEKMTSMKQEESYDVLMKTAEQYHRWKSVNASEIASNKTPKLRKRTKSQIAALLMKKAAKLQHEESGHNRTP